jgi:hypothetical protein
MAIYLVVPLLVVVAGISWVAGLWTRQRSCRWCPDCGALLTCPDCRRAGAHELSIGTQRSASPVDGAA